MKCQDIFDRIDLYLDHALSASESDAMRAHLAGCASCELEVEAARELRNRAYALPGSLEPPRDLWPEIAERIAEEKIVRGRFSRVPRRALLAAAVLFVLAGSVITAYLVGRGQAVQPEARLRPPESVASSAVARASIRGLEIDSYGARAELLDALEARRAELTPETYEMVMVNLAIIDDAIIRIDSALAEHPASGRLAHQLAVAYRQQINLLERAVRLPAEV